MNETSFMKNVTISHKRREGQLSFLAVAVSIADEIGNYSSKITKNDLLPSKWSIFWAIFTEEKIDDLDALQFLLCQKASCAIVMTDKEIA